MHHDSNIMEPPRLQGDDAPATRVCAFLRDGEREIAAGRDAAIDAHLTAEIRRLNGIVPAARKAGEEDAGDADGGLGLDSLAAVELQAQIEQYFGIELPLSEILGPTSVGRLRREILQRLAAAGPSPARAPMTIASASGESPLSFGQQALWFLYRLAPESSAYNLAAAARLRPGSDLALLRRGFEALVARHPALRTVFGERESEPFQRTDPGLVLDWEQIEAPVWDEPWLRQEMDGEANRPFALEQGPPLRVRAWTGPSGECLVMLVVHHLVSDFWSLALAARELAAWCGMPGSSPRSRPSTAAYGDHVAAERRLLATPAGERLLAYWRERLGGDLPVLDLPLDRPRPAVQGYRGAARLAWVDTDVAARVLALAGLAGTPFVVLFSAFAVLLAQRTGQRDLLVGSPAAGRRDPHAAETFGYFVNPLVLRAGLAGDPRFDELLRRLQVEVVGALEHQDYPFALVAEHLQPARDPSRSPLFQALFSFHRVPAGTPPQIAGWALGIEGLRLDLGSVGLESVALATRSSQLDLSLAVAEVDGALAMQWRYDSDLFDAVTVERMAAHFASLLTELADDPSRRVSQLPVGSEAERAQLIREWNDNARAIASPATVDALFAITAAAYPRQVAVVAAGRELTYSELGQRAADLKRRLQSLGVGLEDRVGVLIGPTLDLPVALLAVLGTGAAYLPLDPSYPGERLALMLADAEPKVLLTEPSLLARVPAGPWRPLCIATGEDAAGAAPPAADPEVPAAAALGGGPHPESLAYLIYTSGSTGRPKGVQVTHLALVNFLLAMAERPGLRRGDVVLAVTPLSFDISALEIFLPLLVGARVVLAPRALAADGLALARTIAAHGVTVLQATPVTWRVLLAAGWQGGNDLRAFCGGETLSRELADQLAARCSEAWNLYGPTETTVWSAIEPIVARAGPPGGGVAIGRPIANTSMYVVDADLGLQPIGVAGELCIGGAGVARGYAAQPDTTGARFVPDPFGGAPGGRLYRTGDLARRWPDGRIECLGRLDHQVKVRGFRVELGEIETTLGRHPGIHQAVVAAEGTAGEGRLVAYLVPVAMHEPPPIAELRELLRCSLPEYMVPSLFVNLRALPLTPNGKVDRRRLPAPERPPPASISSLPWESPLEQVVAALWEETLGRRPERSGDDFFALGGHSLKAAQLVSRLRQALGVEIPLSRIFQLPTVAAQAAEVLAALQLGAGAAPEDDAPLSRLERGSELQLSPAQEALWLFSRLQPSSPAYNLPVAFVARGPVDVAALAWSLAEVGRREEVLRTAFVDAGGRPRVVLLTAVAVPLPLIDLAALPDGRCHAEADRWTRLEARRCFAVDRAPLVRAALLRLAAVEHRLLVTAHHLVADGASAEIFTRQLLSLYECAANRPATAAVAAPRRAIGYLSFTAWQRHAQRQARIAAAVEHWRTCLAGSWELDLATDRPRPAAAGYRGAIAGFDLPTDLPRRLAHLGGRRGVTPFMAMLTALQVLLVRYTGQARVVVGAPFSMRSRPELEEVLGYFVNTLPLPGSCPGEVTADDLLVQARDCTLAAYQHREVPFELVMAALVEERLASSAARFQVTLAIRQSLPSMAAAGLTLAGAPVATGTAKFEISLAATLPPDAPRLEAEYRTDIWDATTVQRLLRHLGSLLESLLADPRTPAGELAMISAAERWQLCGEFNDSAAPFEALPVHRRFERWARADPDSLAAAEGLATLSYGELDRRAERLAGRLRQLGIGPEAIAAILLERSLDLIVAALAVLKAGGAYLPIDPAYPHERIAYMLRDASVRVLIVDGRRRGAWETATLTTVDPADAGESGAGENPRPAAAAPCEGPGERRAPVSPQHLAYVIYTSGSTGLPRGVMLAHAGLANLVEWHRRAHHLLPADRTTLLAGPGFDASVWELWAALTAGASLHVVPANLLASPRQLWQWLAARRITSTFLPTPLAEAVLAEPLPADLRLHRLLTGGDRLHGTPGPLPFVLANHYGPTEATVVTTWCPLTAGQAPSIGRPIANLRVQLLDRDQRPVPIGVVGELCVAGPALARGYLQRPEVTAQKFIPDAAGDAGERLYLTGDLALRLAGGKLHFVGRADGQVKIRGFRVEPGEVEVVIGRHPAVAAAAVVPQLDADAAVASLAAFVVPRPGAGPAASELRAFVAEHLPSHMVPAHFVLCDSLPLSANGKVDRRGLRLPAPDATDRGYLAPRSALEELLAALCADVLHLDRLGVHDSFMERGGHSLHAIQIASRIRDALAVEVSPAAVLHDPTVAGLAVTVAAALLDESGGSAAEELLAGLDAAEDGS